MRPALVLAAVLLVAGCSSMQVMPAAEAPPVNGEVVSTVADPVSITIPALKVSDEVVPVGYAPGGEMELPPVTKTGWFEKGPRPGEPGISVIAGHVDWAGTPGAFKHLGALGAGDTITVKDASGVEHTFVVYDTRKILKVDYATQTVPLIFGDTTSTELALITCGGDLHGHEYDSNVLARARLLA